MSEDEIFAMIQAAGIQVQGDLKKTKVRVKCEDFIRAMMSDD